MLGAWLFLSRQSPAVLGFQRQRSVLVLFVGSVIGAVVCTAFGALASSAAFGVPLLQSIALWLSGEFFSYILLLPMFMAAPGLDLAVAAFCAQGAAHPMAAGGGADQ